MTQLLSGSDSEPVTTPEEYREARRGISDYRLAAATVTVTLLDNPRRARYEYECDLQTVGDIPAKYWYYDLPADAVEVTDLRGWDGRGTLQSRMCSGEGVGTQVEVRLRQRVERGERYSFGFGYEAEIRSVVAVGGTSRTVSYADWVIFNIPCDLLQANVELPARSARLSTVPAASDEHGRRIVFRHRGLRPLEAVSFLVAYRRQQIGIPFWKWLGSAIGSGIVGALIAMGLQKF